MSLNQTKAHYEAIQSGSFSTVLKHNYLLGVICIANQGWWTLIRSLTYCSRSIQLLARERLQNANYPVIKITLLE